MNCLFCTESFPGEGELGTHILQKHPEKTQSAEALGMVLREVRLASLAYELAATLTGISIGSKGADPDAVLDRVSLLPCPAVALSKASRKARRGEG